MSYKILLVAGAAATIPLLGRILSSPWLLLLFVPTSLLMIALLILLSPIASAYLLDVHRPPLTNTTKSAAKPLAFSTPAAWQAVLTRSQWTQGTGRPTSKPIHPSSVEVSKAVEDIITLIIRDFVLAWYSGISSSPSFPNAVSGTVHSSLDRLLNRAGSIDIATLAVKKILPKLTAHIEQFRLSEVALRGATLERQLTQSEELDLLLASRYAGRGRLHPAVSNLSSAFTKQTEESHLKALVERALPHILPEAEAGSSAVRIVVREIVACSVLYPVVEMLSDPDFWNKMIDNIAGEAIRQQRLISKVRTILESQSPKKDLKLGDAPVSTTEVITIRTDPRHFESFLRSIGRINSLLDARRLKNDIIGEMRRTRALLADHAKDDWIDGQKTEDVVSFLDRLFTARRKVEERIVALGGVEESKFSTADLSSPSRLSLREVLTNPGFISYLMEFMDRRNRSLLVQFWLTVESFKDPLESIDSGSSGDEDELQPQPSTTSSQTLREDISMVHDLYFGGTAVHPALAAISPKHVQTIRSFATETSPPTYVEERRVRRSVMLAQRQVEQDMEHDFIEFQRSELWFRVIGDLNPNERKASVPAKTATPAKSPIVRRPLPESLPDPTPSSSSASFGLLFGTGSPILSSTPASPSASGYFTRPSHSKLELLMSPTSPSASDSRSPLFDDPNDEQVLAPDEAQVQRIEAIQAALTDIMALDKDAPEEGRVGASSMRRESSTTDSILSPTRSPRGSKRRVLFDDEIGTDVHHPPADTEEMEQSTFQLAAPGDLQLAHEIARLTSKIESLTSQDRMLDTLIQKAELTGDDRELRLLRQSRAAYTRELRELSFQKTQYEQQEAANRLVAERTRVAIVNATTADENGKSVVRYLVEVQQLAVDGSFASGWVVARRYNEFLAMHTKIRDQHALVRNLEFPGKRLVTALSGNFVDTRRVALERYLQGAVAIPAVCESDDLRAFLSRDSPFIAAEAKPATTKTSVSFPGQGLVRTVYKSVTGSIDDMLFGPSMLDVIMQRLTRQAAELLGMEGTNVTDEDLVAQALRASGRTASEATMLRLPGDLKPLEGETSTSAFSAPICDLLLAIFELDEKKNWLRRQAIVIILQQVFGETIERKLRESVGALFSESRLMSYINIFRDGMWPGGRMKPPSIPRTSEEKTRTRDDANRKLSALIPDLAANMIGRSNARRGARRLFAVLQNRRLNQHIVYTVVDEVFGALFPESSQQPR